MATNNVRFAQKPPYLLLRYFDDGKKVVLFDDLLKVEGLEPSEINFDLLWHTKESDVSQPLAFSSF